MDRVFVSASISAGVLYILQRLTQMITETGRRREFDVSERTEEVGTRNRTINFSLETINEGLLVQIDQSNAVNAGSLDGLDLQLEYVESDDGISQPILGDGNYI